MKHAVSYTSIFDIFKPAVGPSSSHTLGPLLCARDFLAEIPQIPIEGTTNSIRVDLYGSLAATGKGHMTDYALIAGLAGAKPELTGSETFQTVREAVTKTKSVAVAGRNVAFDPEKDIHWNRRAPSWTKHPNAMEFTFTSGNRKVQRRYLSKGAGFIEKIGAPAEAAEPVGPIPYPYRTMEDLLAMADDTGFPVSHLILANETAFHGKKGSAILGRLEEILTLMNESIKRGLAKTGELPGGLGVQRRAKRVLAESMRRKGHREGILSPALTADSYALAVSEENASGGAIVTAPTAGSAGVLPAVLKVLERDLTLPKRTLAKGLLTAGAVAVVIKNQASLSGAEVGCQGEVGSAAAMAAAAAAELAGATPAQVETAAEIAMEHHLGMTCDPVGGLVQIPCIERNAMGAVKALNAAAVSFAGTGKHLISFDAAVRVMWKTGQDLKTAYRETGRGGLARL